MCINLTKHDQVKYISPQQFSTVQIPQALCQQNTSLQRASFSISPLWNETAGILICNYSIVNNNEKDDLHSLYGILHARLMIVKDMQDRIMNAKKKCYFYKKLLDTLLNDMKSPGIIIIGCPQLTLKQLYTFFATLSKRLKIHFNDTNIALMVQTRSEWRKTNPLVTEQIPILVKLKTLKIKDLYLSAVKEEMKLSESAKKFGFQVHNGKDLLKGIFINDQLTQDKLILYRFVFSQSKKLGYQCFVNNSKIYIRKSKNHKPIIVNSRHLLRVLDEKKYTHELISDITTSSSSWKPGTSILFNRRLKYKRRRVWV